MNRYIQYAVDVSISVIVMFAIADSVSGMESDSNIRVPAEWDPQVAIWLQWPGPYERAHEEAFAAMSAVIVQYEQIHILCDSDDIRQQARVALSKTGTNPDHDNITWHTIPNDNAWMRDNGPVYVVVDGEMRIQNWKFNAWGGAFGLNIPYSRDNEVPIRIGEYLKMPVDTVEIVHERGNLEFNGVDTVIVNWSVLGDPDRNPGYTSDQAEADMKRHFGVSKVILIEGIPVNDLTKGHVDGIARFIDAETVVVTQCTAASNCKPGDGRDDAVYENAAKTIEDHGFRVIRDPMEAVVRFRGQAFDTNYVNWIVGNGFVILVGFGNPQTDLAAKSRVESYFPSRDIHVVEMLSSWASGGGAHCHTNDQPVMSNFQKN